jgi:hypothetical protein
VQAPLDAQLADCHRPQRCERTEIASQVATLKLTVVASRVAERLVAGTACEATLGDRAERFHGDRS